MFNNAVNCTNVNLVTASKNKTIIFKQAALVVSMAKYNESKKNVEADKLLSVYYNNDVIIQNGIIAEIGESIATKYANTPNCEIIDAEKLVLMPGLIDAHNHSLFAGSRANETVFKAQGLSYEDIAARGGGIVATMRATRAASDAELMQNFVMHAQHSLALGVVCMDVKTGYGLNPQEEIRHFNCLINACKNNTNLPFIAPTLLGPHAASPDFLGLDNFVQALIESLPQLASTAQKAQKEGIILPAAADIFIERNYFTKENGINWLGAAMQHGLNIHIHADEFSRSGGAEVALELAERAEQAAERTNNNARVLSIDHCQYTTESDLAQLAKRGVCAVALPTTSFFSGIAYINAAHWRASGVRAAIASDFNPGSSPFNNIWFSAYLALKNCGFSLAEVIAGVTVNAAYALGVQNTFGVIDVGKPANIVAFAGTKLEDFFASPLGEHVRYVVKAI